MSETDIGRQPAPGQLEPVHIEGETRIRDTDLGTRLGFAKAAKIRDLIKRHRVSLEAMGVLPTVGITPENNGLGGAPATAYFLNRKQAIFITAKSDTALATEITIEVIQRFDAYERGEMQALQLTDDVVLAKGLLIASSRLEDAQRRIEVLAPKAEALDRIAEADGSHCITDAAKLLQIRPKDLFDYLDRNSWTYRRAGADHWCAYQARIASGDLVHKVTTVLRPDGSEKTTEQVRITAKGLTKLAKLLPPAVTPVRLRPPGPTLPGMAA